MDEWFGNFFKFVDMIHQESEKETKKQEFSNDMPKSEKKLIYGIGPNSVPYAKILRITTYTEIQEGEFEEIEDTETGEASIGELANQASDRREEILSDEADKG